MLTFIVLLLFAGVVAFDFVPQIKQAGGSKKTSAVYIVFLIVSFTVLLLYSFGVEVPSPAVPIKNIVGALFGVK
jgi:uncharacterized protein with PQ loop repeat